MKKLFYIQASPRGPKSDSIQIADAYLEALSRPDIEIETFSLWEEELLSFGEVQTNAKTKVMTGQPLEGVEKEAWEEISTVSKRFIAADRYLLAVPMWNGSIPYRLKHYIDIVHQPGLTWGINPKTGFFGLLKNKQATIVLTAGAYAPGAPERFGPDYQWTYLRDWLKQAGVEKIDEIRFQPTLLTSDRVSGFEQAKKAAIALAGRHATELTVP